MSDKSAMGRSKTVIITGFGVMLVLMVALIAVGLQTRPEQQLIYALEIGLLLLGLFVAYLVIRRAAQTEAALHREKERAEVTLHSIGDGVITANASGYIDYLNPVAETLTGCSSGEARGQPLTAVYRLIDDETRKPLDYPAARWLTERMAEAENRPVRLVHRDGREIPIEDSVAPIRDREGGITGMVVVFHDISHIRAMAEQLSWQAGHDVLTGLANRREFERRLVELLESARSQDQQHALLYMDLDKFKAVNDTCGHIGGDEFLRQLAAAMEIKVRGSDTLARLGGDEFGVLLEACPLDQAIRIANGLAEAVRDFRFVWNDQTFNVGVSVGLVPLDAASGTPAAVLAAADASCYGAKEKGGRIQVYRPASGDFGQEHGDLALVSQLHQAFDEGNFRLYRQKIVPLGHGQPHHEILVRMVDSAGNLMAPIEFIPTAERYSLLPVLDRWVISNLIGHLRGNLASGHKKEESVYAINLSGASINDSTFPDFLRKQLSLHHVPPALLCFEITETTAIANLAKAAELMQELKALGCRFALDDFGIGMSSFAYLKHLPVDFLKIDGTFVKDMAKNPMDFAIVEAINRIGHIMGMQTIAEFVEDARVLEKLRELKVDFAQGDAVGGPEPLVVKHHAAEVNAS